MSPVYCKTHSEAFLKRSVYFSDSCVPNSADREGHLKAGSSTSGKLTFQDSNTCVTLTLVTCLSLQVEGGQSAGESSGLAGAQVSVLIFVLIGYLLALIYIQVLFFPQSSVSRLDQDPANETSYSVPRRITSHLGTKVTWTGCCWWGPPQLFLLGRQRRCSLCSVLPPAGGDGVQLAIHAGNPR